MVLKHALDSSKETATINGLDCGAVFAYPYAHGNYRPKVVCQANYEVWHHIL